MKILVINTCPFFNDGITNVIMNLQDSIAHAQFRMDLVVTAEPSDSFLKKMQDNECNVYYIKRTMKSVYKYLKSLILLIKKNNYDIVHIHGNSHTTVLELFAAFVAGCRTRIVHAHNTFCKEKAIHFFMTPIFNALCTGRLACGEAAGIFMHGKHKFCVINNGIKTNRFMFSSKNRIEIRKQLGLCDKFIIGHVGTLYNEQKNQEFLFDIIVALKKYRKDVHLCLVGDGEDRENFKKSVAEMGIEDDVTFVGAVDDAAPYLSAFDIVVMPSLYEGLPLSLIEEQANGLNCFVSDVITREVNKTGNVKFFSLKNMNAWVDELRKIGLQEDRKHESELAISEIAKSGYSIEDEARKLEKIYMITQQ